MNEAAPTIYTRLSAWLEVKRQAAALAEQEMTLRKAIFAELFPVPVEGVNTAVLDKITVKATHKLNRTLDEPALATAWGSLIEQHIPVDQLIKTKPELVLAAYRDLTPEQYLIFDQFLTIKPGAPSIEVKETK